MVIIYRGTAFTFDNMDDLYYNCIEIREKLNDAGITIGTFQDFRVKRGLSQSDFINRLNPTELETLMDRADTTIETINNALPFSLKNKYKYTKQTQKQKKVWQWIDFINSLGGLTFTLSKLTDRNGEEITDSNGQKIYTLEV